MRIFLTLLIGLLGTGGYFLSLYLVLHSDYKGLPVVGSGVGRLFTYSFVTFIFVGATLLLQIILGILIKRKRIWLILAAIYALGIGIHYTLLFSKAKLEYVHRISVKG